MYNTLSVGITRLCRRGGAGRCSQYVESKAIPLHLLLVVLLHLLHAGHLQKGAQTIEILPRHLHLPLAGQNLSHIVQDGLVDGRPKLRHGCRLTFGQERQRHLVRGKGFLGRRGVPTAVEGVDVMRQGHVEHLDCQKFRAGFSALLGREVGMGLKGFGTVVRIEQYRPGVHDEAAMVVHAMGKGGGRRLVLRVQRLNVRLNLADGLVRLGDDGAVILGGRFEGLLRTLRRAHGIGKGLGCQLVLRGFEEGDADVVELGGDCLVSEVGLDDGHGCWCIYV